MCHDWTKLTVMRPATRVPATAGTAWHKQNQLLQYTFTPITKITAPQLDIILQITYNRAWNMEYNWKKKTWNYQTVCTVQISMVVDASMTLCMETVCNFLVKSCGVLLSLWFGCPSDKNVSACGNLSIPLLSSLLLSALCASLKCYSAFYFHFKIIGAII